VSLESLVRQQREKVLDKASVENIKRLEEELAERARAGRLDAVKAKLDRELDTLTSTEGDLTRIDARIKELDLTDESSPALDALEALGKIRMATINDNPNLSLALTNRIRQADVMLMIGQTFALYGRWVEFEFETARFASRRIPILGLVPPGQSVLPLEIRNRCDEAVSWEPSAIVDGTHRLLARASRGELSENADAGTMLEQLRRAVLGKLPFY
jgi:hypothetical protein